MTTLITCPMCGHPFDAQTPSSCSSCPLHKGCNLTCCPECGYEVVNVQASKLARFVGRFLPMKTKRLEFHANTLANVHPGGHARVLGFSDDIPTDRKAHLQAFGLVPGHAVRVMQHKPVTILQVDHTELALEKGLAQQVQVEMF